MIRILEKKYIEMADLTGVSSCFALKMNDLNRKSRYYLVFSRHTWIDCQTHSS